MPWTFYALDVLTSEALTLFVLTLDILTVDLSFVPNLFDLRRKDQVA